MIICWLYQREVRLVGGGGELTYTNMAKTNHKDSKFIKVIRVTKVNHEYLWQVTGKYTLAGRLDEMINFCKKSKIYQNRLNKALCKPLASKKE